MYFRKARLRLAGHVSQVDKSKLPNKVLFGEKVDIGEESS